MNYLNVWKFISTFRSTFNLTRIVFSLKLEVSRYNRYARLFARNCLCPQHILGRSSSTSDNDEDGVTESAEVAQRRETVTETGGNAGGAATMGPCGLSVRYCGTRCGTEPSSSYCRFPVINAPHRAPATPSSFSPPDLPRFLSLSRVFSKYTSRVRVVLNVVTRWLWRA